MTTDKKNFAPQIYKGTKPPHEGDLSKRWFVYVTKATPTGNKRLKYYGQINDFDTISERLKECQRIIDQIKAELSNGEGKYYQHLLTKELNKRALNQRKKGISTYESKLKIFLSWINYLPPSEVKPVTAEKFIEHLFHKQLSPTTVNAYKVLLKSLFKSCPGVRKNPFENIAKFKESRKSLMYFDSADIEKIRARLEWIDPEQWLAAQFIYYCFIRPGELRNLKWQQVNFTTGQVYIPADISKNGKAAFVTLPDPFIKYLQALGYDKRNKTAYIVGKNGGAQQYGRDTISKQHRKHLLALGFSSDYSLYSWKHTGVVKVALSGINMKELQIQLRHHSLDMVDEYLKNLGVYDCAGIKSKFPSIT